jgi:CBS domain-containing protein
MLVSDILAAKKDEKVHTVRPDDSIENLVQRLRMERIGALVVSEQGYTVDGIISERDVAHGLAEHGAEILNRKVRDLMTGAVITRAPGETLANIAKLMTQRRIRHVPIVDGNRLIGIVSIGDVVRYRLDELELEQNVLRDYAVARH